MTLGMNNLNAFGEGKDEYLRLVDSPTVEERSKYQDEIEDLKWRNEVLTTLVGILCDHIDGR